jgi:hypothetical protein
MYVEKTKSKLNSFEYRYKKHPSDLLMWGFLWCVPSISGLAQ